MKTQGKQEKNCIPIHHNPSVATQMYNKIYSKIFTLVINKHMLLYIGSSITS